MNYSCRASIVNFNLKSGLSVARYGWIVSLKMAIASIIPRWGFEKGKHGNEDWREHLNSFPLIVLTSFSVLCDSEWEKCVTSFS